MIKTYREFDKILKNFIAFFNNIFQKFSFTILSLRINLFIKFNFILSHLRYVVINSNRQKFMDIF